VGSRWLDDRSRAITVDVPYVKAGTPDNNHAQRTIRVAENGGSQMGCYGTHTTVVRETVTPRMPLIAPI
jgi:hypothetical protein